MLSSCRGAVAIYVSCHIATLSTQAGIAEVLRYQTPIHRNLDGQSHCFHSELGKKN